MANRVVASGVVPYPPGIPLLMPGENAGPADGIYLSYLRSLQAWDRRFPGGCIIRSYTHRGNACDRLVKLRETLVTVS